MAAQPADLSLVPADLDRVRDELYAGPPEDFVAIRSERVKRARTAKDRALATAIAALRRPTRSAWMVNLLARGEPDQLAGLLDLGEALRLAQEQLSGPDLRRLSADRHRAVEALTRRAVALAADQGANATEAIRREISQSLQAALADPETAELVRAGWLSQPADYSGFGPIAWTSSNAPVETVESPTPEPLRVIDADADSAENERRENERQDAEQREAEQARARHRAELVEAHQQVDDAAAEVVNAATERDRLVGEVTRAAAALAEAEHRSTRAAERAAASDRSLTEARQALHALERSG